MANARNIAVQHATANLGGSQGASATMSHLYAGPYSSPLPGSSNPRFLTPGSLQGDGVSTDPDLVPTPTSGHGFAFSDGPGLHSSQTSNFDNPPSYQNDLFEPWPQVPGNTKDNDIEFQYFHGASAMPATTTRDLQAGLNDSSLMSYTQQFTDQRSIPTNAPEPQVDIEMYTTDPDTQSGPQNGSSAASQDHAQAQHRKKRKPEVQLHGARRSEANPLERLRENSDDAVAELIAETVKSIESIAHLGKRELGDVSIQFYDGLQRTLGERGVSPSHGMSSNTPQPQMTHKIGQWGPDSCATKAPSVKLDVNSAYNDDEEHYAQCYDRRKRLDPCQETKRKAEEHRSNPASTEDIYPCLRRGCNQTYAKGAWKRHHQQFNPDRLWVCPHCPKIVYNRQEYLVKHLLGKEHQDQYKTKDAAQRMAERYRDPYEIPFRSKCGIPGCGFETRDWHTFYEHILAEHFEREDPVALKRQWDYDKAPCPPRSPFEDLSKNITSKAQSAGRNLGCKDGSFGNNQDDQEDPGPGTGPAGGRRGAGHPTTRSQNQKSSANCSSNAGKQQSSSSKASDKKQSSNPTGSNEKRCEVHDHDRRDVLKSVNNNRTLRQQQFLTSSVDRDWSTEGDIDRTSSNSSTPSKRLQRFAKGLRQQSLFYQQHPLPVQSRGHMTAGAKFELSNGSFDVKREKEDFHCWEGKWSASSNFCYNLPWRVLGGDLSFLRKLSNRYGQRNRIVHGSSAVQTHVVDIGLEGDGWKCASVSTDRPLSQA